jgi:hypothetical protein
LDLTTPPPASALNMMVPPPPEGEGESVLVTQSPVSFFHTFMQKHYVNKYENTVDLIE